MEPRRTLIHDSLPCSTSHPDGRKAIHSTNTAGRAVSEITAVCRTPVTAAIIAEGNDA